MPTNAQIELKRALTKALADGGRDFYYHIKKGNRPLSREEEAHNDRVLLKRLGKLRATMGMPTLQEVPYYLGMTFLHRENVNGFCSRTVRDDATPSRRAV